MKNKFITMILATAMALTLCACGGGESETTDTDSAAASYAEEAPEEETPAEEADEEETVSEEAPEDADEPAEANVEPVELTILAAASLTDVCGELETMYKEEHPEVTLTFSFGSSGALQTQIEEGAPADIFFSASTKQMDALKEEELMDDASITELLENKIVMVVPKGSDKGITAFEDAATDKVSMIGLGEPESVPAGQYAEEVFTSLGILDEVKAKANYGTDVRTVLSWVEAGEVDCGVVYATDAYTTEDVEIVAEAPEGSCKKVIYPVGIVGATENSDAAGAFVDFLKSDGVIKIFEKYGFAKV